MFEKSLYDLIRGLRSHKGNETEYIQGTLKECRTEIRSQDMDVKATALLKLIYLEMFGYDMSWAAFNVLEVMSSPKHIQKRVGYLAAIQSFHAETEVLMLAPNLLKKDLTSPAIPIMSLPLITLPHIITSSLALSLLTDILPRLGHSQPAIRKKTVVTLYRLALVYPETLRVAWPKMKDLLMDENEDSSVTAAVVNVVCELGWRRPQDFLSLAPRLFELLIDSGNNWMAIKIIKLFATLTPLEPRLVKKLVKPLTNLIQSTAAMSLLYECISGIIHGGILQPSEDSYENEQVANLCISKLRGMIIVEGDPNLKYVALLAFNKIVVSHPLLVAAQQDVILGCLDDPDVSIRLQALELVSGMVSSDNLQSIVNRLLVQLQNSPLSSHDEEESLSAPKPIELVADPDDEDPGEKLAEAKRNTDMQPLPNEYRHEVISRILDMASAQTYSNIIDFEWYLEVLVSLVKVLPLRASSASSPSESGFAKRKAVTIGSRIGSQILDIAVRVKALRSEAVRSAESLLLLSNRNKMVFLAGDSASDVLEPASWLVGEYAYLLLSPQDSLDFMIHESSLSLPSSCLASYVQAVPKVFSMLATRYSHSWSPTQKTMLSLLLARIIHFMEGLSSHSNLEVQERSVEYLELFRLASESLSSQGNDEVSAPGILTSAIPSLFSGDDFNPVSAEAQRKVNVPEDLDLEMPINPNLASLLQQSQQNDLDDSDQDEYRAFYYERERVVAEKPSAVKKLASDVPETSSYQEDPELAARRRQDRKDRAKDDPFYIALSGQSSGRSTPFHEVLAESNGQEVDIDAIPIVDLQLDNADPIASYQEETRSRKKKKPLRRVEITADETVGEDLPSGASSRPRSRDGRPPPAPVRPNKNLLSVDSSQLRQFSLSADEGEDPLDVEKRQAEEAEMAEAIKNVERLRLEMQRAAEKSEVAEGVEQEGAVVKRKKKKKAKAKEEDVGDAVDGGDGPPAEVVKKKKKKKVKGTENGTKVPGEEYQI